MDLTSIARGIADRIDGDSIFADGAEVYASVDSEVEPTDVVVLCDDRDRVLGRYRITVTPVADETPGRSVGQTLLEDQRPVIDRDGHGWWLHPGGLFRACKHHQDGACESLRGLTLAALLMAYGPLRPARDGEIEGGGRG